MADWPFMQAPPGSGANDSISASMDQGLLPLDEGGEEILDAPVNSTGLLNVSSGSHCTPIRRILREACQWLTSCNESHER